MYLLDRKSITIFAFFLFVAFHAHAEQKNAEFPERILFPWRTLGIQPETRVRAQKALTEISKWLESQWMTNAAPVSAAIAKDPNAAFNTIRASERMRAGKAKSGTNSPQGLEPVWCSIADRFVVFLQSMDGSFDTLVASAHITLPRQQWEDLEKQGALAPQLKSRLEPVLAKMSANPSAPTSKSALHLGFAVAKETTRDDEGSSLCLNLLLAEKLIQNATTIRPVGGEEAGLVRYALKSPLPALRQTRTIVTRWEFPKHRSPQKLTFPLTLTMESTFAEAVLGQNIPPPMKAEYPLTLQSDGTLSLPVQANLMTFVEREKTSLARESLPRISKIDRAWVYLDKGRAWGLNMDDRLVSQDGGKQIFGHVVGFFGADLGLKSPQGFTIQEGAIVFIRKGQRETRIGQTFGFDPKTYPASR